MNDQFFNGGWCWMTHPDYNDAKPIPVWMLEVDGVKFYHPLDPSDATDFEWDRRDEQWQIVVPPLGAHLLEFAVELLRSAKAVVDYLDSFQPEDNPVRVERDSQMIHRLRAAVNSSVAGGKV